MVALPAAAPAARLGHHEALDGLRALSVAGVLASHLGGPAARGGSLGVDAFFVLSGFLITALLLEERRSTGALRLGRFYARRALRLLPALLALLAVVLGAQALAGRAGEAGRAALWVLLYAGNWALIAGASLAGVPHTWSLAVEEQFYLALPPLLRAAAGRLSPRGLALALAALAAAAAAWRAALALGGASDARLYDGTDARADQLLLGCLAAVAHASGLLPAWLERRRALVGGAAGALALALAAAGPDLRVLALGGRALFAALVALLILGALDARSGPARLLAWGPLPALGRRSYSLYLWHLPVVEALRAAGLRGWPLGALAVAASLAAAALSYALLERPLLGLRARLAGPR